MKAIKLEIQGIHLVRDSLTGQCEVRIQVGNEWVRVIRDRGEVISHIVEPAGIYEAVKDKPWSSSVIVR